MRKRIQRGTLASGRWPDGHRYVYWYAEKPAPIGTEAPEFQNQAHMQRRSWVEHVATVSGLVALLGGLTYGLGLLDLWIPIAVVSAVDPLGRKSEPWVNRRRNGSACGGVEIRIRRWVNIIDHRYIRMTYTHDLSTAWYAVSLVPRTVVAGLGFGQLFAIPTLGLLLGGGLMILAARLYAPLKNRWGVLPKILFYDLLFFVSQVVLVPIIGKNHGWDLQTQILILIGIEVSFHVVVLLAWVIIFWLLSEEKDPLAFYKEHREFFKSLASPESDERPASYGTTQDPAHNDSDARRGWVLPLASIAFVYLLAAVSVGISSPALPTIELTGAKSVRGALLTHTDGFWYVFDPKGDNRGKLIAIPDAEVHSAQIFHEENRQERSLFSALFSEIRGIWHSHGPDGSNGPGTPKGNAVNAKFVLPYRPGLEGLAYEGP